MDNFNKIFRLKLIIIFYLVNYQCLACDCIGINSVKNEIKKSDIIFIGKIISKKLFKIQDESFPLLVINKVEFTVLIKSVYKGKIDSNEIKIITGNGNGDCGINFKIGIDYIIYSSYAEKYFELGHKVDKFITSDICTRTKVFEIKEDKKIRKILRKHPPSWRGH